MSPDRADPNLVGDWQFKTALERVRKHLRESKARPILVGAANDPSALGAARAFQEAGRADGCAIVGQNAEPDAPALDILGGRAVPPAVFVKDQIITRENVDHVYPNDALMGVDTYARI